jgi:hypothetical protein
VTRAAAALALVALVGGAGCVRIIHDGSTTCDGSGGDGGATPSPVHAQALFVVDLDRASANLVGSYAGLIDGLRSALAERLVIVDQVAVLPIYGGVTGMPALVYGDPGGGDLAAVLGPTANGGLFDHPLPGVTAEQYNLATIAPHLDTATLPPELTNGESRPFFSPPTDLFLVVTIHPTRRLCAESDSACTIGGVAPVDVFSAAAGDGTAAWLKLPGGSYPRARIYQVFLTTSEGESAAAFQQRCGGLPGFPKTLLDVIAPSPASYYGDLATGLSAEGWHAERLDLCEAFAAGGEELLRGLAGRIALAGH